MSRFRHLMIAASMMLAVAGFAQQKAPDGASASAAAQPSATAQAEEHLQKLNEKLNLSESQREKIRPLIVKMLDHRQKLMDDKSMTDEERSQKMKALHERADHELRAVLNDEQKKKLDELESEGHHK